jgi:hypothetical protein
MNPIPVVDVTGVTYLLNLDRIDFIEQDPIHPEQVKIYYNSNIIRIKKDMKEIINVGLIALRKE